MSLDVTRLSPVLGVTVSGLDTSKPASAATVSEIRSLLSQHKLVVIKGGQRLTPEQVGTLGRSLGLGATKEFGAKHLSSNLKLTDDAAVASLEYGPELPAAKINLWHQDHTWHSQPTRYELSYADVVTLGGDVLYADCVAAYKSLSPRMSQLIDGTSATALLANGYAELPFPTPAYARSMLSTPSVRQPVVSLVDGERVLTVNKAYSVRIAELSADESACTLQLLTNHIARPEHTLRVAYDVGDVVIFDNHKLQHYAVSDYFPEPRRILRMSFHPQAMVAADPLPPHDWPHRAGTNVAATCDKPSVDPLPASKRARTAEPASRAPCHVAPGDGTCCSSMPHQTTTLGAPPGPAAKVGQLATKLTAALRLLDRGAAPQSDLCAGFFAARLTDTAHGAPPLFVSGPTHGTFWREATPSTFGVFRATIGADTPHRCRVVGDGPLPNYPSTAVPAAVFAACPHINAIVHAHPRSMMALSALDSARSQILPMSEPSFMFYERVAHLPCNFFFDDPYLEKIVDALRDGSKFAISMANHSYLMTGKTVEEAYLRAYMLEQSASIQLAALSAAGGTLPPAVSREECLFHRASYEGYAGCPPYDGSLEWLGLVRTLDADCPGWSADRGEWLANAFARVDAANLGTGKA